MPLRESSNAQILPANARAVDVAQRALHDVAAIQQAKYNNAFLVAGYESLLYHIQESGSPCSCGSRSRALSTRLGEDGKLDRGQINKLITGGYEFKVNPYGTKMGNSVEYATEHGIPLQPHSDTSIWESVDSLSQLTPEMNGVTRSMVDPTGFDVDVETRNDANGPKLPQDILDSLSQSAFDTDELGLSDVSCPICMGTGFVGGFLPEGGYRKILTPDDILAEYDGTLDPLVRPLAAEDVTYFKYQFTLPKGALRVDALNVWHKNKMVAATFMVDAVPLTSVQQLVHYADGAPHLLYVLFPAPTRFTHVEIQLGLTHSLPRIDFPKLVQGSDLRKLDSTEDVSLVASPTVSLIRRKDILVESNFGKAFQVVSVPVWVDNSRRVMGWEFQARVIQPQELYALLPRRRQMKQQATNLVRPNANQGNNRT